VAGKDQIAPLVDVVELRGHPAGIARSLDVSFIRITVLGILVSPTVRAFGNSRQPGLMVHGAHLHGEQYEALMGVHLDHVSSDLSVRLGILEVAADQLDPFMRYIQDHPCVSRVFDRRPLARR
jgi:hypothetical protein